MTDDEVFLPLMLLAGVAENVVLDEAWAARFIRHYVAAGRLPDILSIQRRMSEMGGVGCLATRRRPSKIVPWFGSPVVDVVIGFATDATGLILYRTLGGPSEMVAI